MLDILKTLLDRCFLVLVISLVVAVVLGVASVPTAATILGITAGVHILDHVIHK